MVNFSKILKIIKGFFPIAFLVFGIFAGTAGKDNKDNSETSLKQSPNWDFKSEARHSAGSITESNEPSKAVCSDALANILEEDENALVLNGYAGAKVVECMSVGCGGIF